MKLLRLVTGWESALIAASALVMATVLLAATVPGDWEQPAGALAEQIASALGPGQATLTVRNFSSIAASDLPAIRALFEKDLKARGITLGSGESATAIRVTLSQNDRERLWVAEVVQGNETRVLMVPAGSGPTPASASADYMTLRRERMPILKSTSDDSSDEPALAAFEGTNSLIILRPETMDLFAFDEG